MRVFVYNESTFPKPYSNHTITCVNRRKNPFHQHVRSALHYHTQSINWAGTWPRRAAADWAPVFSGRVFNMAAQWWEGFQLKNIVKPFLLTERLHQTASPSPYQHLFAAEWSYSVYFVMSVTHLILKLSGLELNNFLAPIVLNAQFRSPWTDMFVCIIDL